VKILDAHLVKTQTNDEWWADYDRASGVEHEALPSWRNKDIDGSRHLFRYLDHRTTPGGSVVMEFETLNHTFRAVRFFNVSLISTRGKKYPAGHRGQFNPPKQGKFRKFWLQAVGQPPSRWCRVHKQMRSMLGSLVFVGAILHQQDSKGQHYVKLTEIKPQ